GAQQVWGSHDDARDAAVNLAALNEAGSKPVMLNVNVANDPAGDLVIGEYDREAKTFTATTDRQIANAVRVVARRTTGSAAGPLPLFFGPIFEKDTAEVVRYAIAVAIGGPAENSIIALNPKDKNSFYIYGNPTVDLGEGSVQVDSSSQQGTLFQGTNFEFIAGQVNMVGNYYERGNANVENTTDLNPGEPYVADPLAGLPVPSFEPLMVPPGRISGTSDGVQRVFNPGYYPSGLRMNAGEKVFLNPGVYVLSNQGNSNGSAFFTNGHCVLTGYGVMFYIKQGNVDHNGTGDVHLTPPQDGVYKGIQFFQARNNTAKSFLRGTGVFTGASADVNNSAGTMYFPAASLEIGGTGDMYVDSVVADKIVIYGAGTKYVTRGYDGRRGGDEVYLVE
ncbi:MAG: hypothetical protein ABIP55_00155, partial [Tepidisphaeraceae bacterium]